MDNDSRESLPSTSRGSARPLYAIGDVHGDVERLLKLLVAHDIIETTSDTFRWLKCGIVVVLMGDVLDARALSEGLGDMAFQGTTSDLWLLEFLMIASRKAKEAGSDIYALVGEHEVNNIRLDFDGVSPYHLRDTAARAAYFGPGGNGMRALSSVFLTSLVYNRVLYMHAGPPLDMTIEQKALINKRVSVNMLTDEKHLDALASLVRHTQYGSDPTPAQQEALETMLRRRGAKRLVVGHYFTRGNGVFSGWGGRVVYTDVGLSRAYMPNATPESSSLLYDDGDGNLRVLHLDGEARDVPVSGIAASTSAPPS